MKKFSINSQLRNKLFFIAIHRFSLVRAAMNALRICKMRNGVSNRRASLFNDDFSNEPNFGRIYLAGQYL